MIASAEFLEGEKRRLILVENERRKLMAGALDRLSTAFVAVGVLGQILSLNPATANMNVAIAMFGWISGAALLHWSARRVLGGLKL